LDWWNSDFVDQEVKDAYFSDTKTILAKEQEIIENWKKVKQ